MPNRYCRRGHKTHGRDANFCSRCGSRLMSWWSYALNRRSLITEQPWHVGRAAEQLRTGLVIEMHPGHVPSKGQEAMFRDERAGTNWIGVEAGPYAVRIVRPAGDSA